MIRLLTLLCGLFVAIIAAEVLARPSASAPSPNTARRAAVAIPVKLAGAPDPARGQWLTEVLARPLFAPDRRPVPGAVSTDPALPRLAGIIGTQDGTVAIFQPDGGGTPVLAHHGEHVGGWQVSSIDADQVTLQKAGERIVLTPRFNPAAATSAIAPRLAGPLLRH